MEVQGHRRERHRPRGDPAAAAGLLRRPHPLPRQPLPQPQPAGAFDARGSSRASQRGGAVVAPRSSHAVAVVAGASGSGGSSGGAALRHRGIRGGGGGMNGTISPLTALDVLQLYAVFLGLALVVFVVYLVIPKQPRGGSRTAAKRQTNHRGGAVKDGGVGMGAARGGAATRPHRNGPRVQSQVHRQRDDDDGDDNLHNISLPRHEPYRDEAPEARQAPSQGGTFDAAVPQNSATAAYHFGGDGGDRAMAVSPRHPAHEHRVPRAEMVRETMARLEGRGVRLTAHGVRSPPQRVWIRVDRHSHTLQWHTERVAPTSSTPTTAAANDGGGGGTLSLVRGQVRTVPLRQVRYIDVGKKTAAFTRLSDAAVPAGACCSILTDGGSLDVQAHSRPERDALVSCLSLLLDRQRQGDGGGGDDWRRFHDEASSSNSNSNSILTTTTTAAPSSAAVFVGSGYRRSDVRPSSSSRNNISSSGYSGLVANAGSTAGTVGRGAPPSMTSSALSEGLSDI